MNLTSVFHRRASTGATKPVTANWEAGGATTPDKFTSLALEATGQPGLAEKGQVLVMFAVFMIGLMGMLGLATDVGFSLAARRTTQGAADAGAFAGARKIAQYTAASPTNAISEVQTIVGSNDFGGHVPTVYTCEYIGNNWSVVGTCNQNVPANAAGARVRTRMTVPTFFIRVLPGAPSSVKVGGYAKARVQNAKNVPSDGPFIVCDPNTKTANSATTMNIVASTNPLKLNPAAIGKVFRIHDPQLDKANGADCSTQGARFKGLNDQAANATKKAGDWFKYDTGAKAGPTRSKVEGAGACAVGTADPNGCVMILPIATNSPAESGNSKTVKILGFAAFEVTTVDANSHNGRLLDDYIIAGDGANNWCRDCGGIVVIRLIW